MTLSAVLDHIDADQPRALERLFALLRIASVSTDPAYAEACRAPRTGWRTTCAASASMRAAAIRRAIRWWSAMQGGDGPHYLFYGHYDVQPVDPPHLWHRPPFDPAIEETPHGPAIVARGASDDKGQLMTFVEACRAWRAVTGALPARVSILFEGEEESGSASLVPFLRAHAEELRADMALVCDTGMWDRETPAITTMLRGMVGASSPSARRPRPAFGGLRRGGDQPDPGAGGDHRRAARRRGADHPAGFYDGVPAARPGDQGAMGAARGRGGAVPGRGRLEPARGRAGSRCWSRSGRGRPAT